MIKSVFQKWEELKKKAINFNETYIATYYLGASSITNLYFSLNANKMKAYIEFTKEVLAEFEAPNIQGMVISVTSIESIDKAKKYICIENNIDNEEIFIAFTSSLADVLSTSKSYYDVYSNFVEVVKEYKFYFSNANKTLSKEKEQGLCAELIELRKMILKKGETVILNWQGPSKNKRDFVFEKTALEVKSTSNQINVAIKITNENQLDINYPIDLKYLFLSIYIIEEVDIGFDVVSCANDIINLITSASLREAFKINLLKLGIEIETYVPGYKFKIQKHDYYVINDLFPKITKKIIDNKIYDVSYRIKIEELKNFIVQKEQIYEQLQ